MTDVNKFIAELLADTAHVELVFPDAPEELPVITLSETGNAAAVVLSGKDRFSVITLQLDVFAEDAETVHSLAETANSKLAELGIKRVFAQMLTDEKFPRMCMKFKFMVDEVSGRVFAPK